MQRHSLPVRTALVPPLTAVALALVAGCDARAGAEASGGAFTVRDSAGVRIVDNVEAPGPADGWRVSEAPEVSIGQVDGEEAYLLDGVAGARRLEDGRIVVANSGASELRFFDREGRHLQTVGREGEGPGEFQGAISALLVGPGDTLLVYEYLARRGSWFAPDGGFIATLALPSIGDGAWSRPVGVFDDGTVLAYAERGLTGDDGRVDEPVLYYRADADGNVLDSIGRFPVRSYHVRQVPMGGGIALVSVVPAFEPTPAAVLGRNRFHFGFADRFEVAVHTLDGTLERLVRLDRPRAPVAAAERERALDQYPDSTDVGRAYRQTLEDIGFPEAMPAHGPMQVDGPGNLWVADYRPFGEGDQRWTVFDPEGRRLGTVSVPGSIEVQQIGDDYVLGLREDELGVEYVEISELVKGS